MDTATISYRVADFLKKYPPFNAMAEQDLIALAASGRVRFYEPNQYVLWQGEPHRHQVFVIQQGTVSLWDEAGGQTELRDVRGAGDMLGIERYNDAPAAAHSARSESDVVVYAFSASGFGELLAKYPRARQYVAAEGHITVDYHAAGERRDPATIFLQHLAGQRPLAFCADTTTIRDAAERLRAAATDALAVVDEQHRPYAVLTSRSFLDWIAGGGIDADLPVRTLIGGPPVVVGPRATVTDGVLAMGTSASPALAITDDGTPSGRLSGVVSDRDFGSVFGEHPGALLQDIRMAPVQMLREVNHRLRAFTLHHLTNASSIDWLSRFTHLADAEVVRRLIGMAGGSGLRACWCFCGSSGRSESLTRLAPQVLLILDDAASASEGLALYRRVLMLLADCDYLPRPIRPFAPEYYVAPLAEWRHRFDRWVTDPVRAEMYNARRLFDLTAIAGDVSLWQQIEAEVVRNVDVSFLNVIANDCLATLPPLTFFEDAVVDKSGEQKTVFHLEDTALRPLVDVGRVFALAGGTAVGRSTLERFATARALLPDQQNLFREAADTFRVVLWQQGRIGISEGTSGIDLPPSLLSRHDRHVLKAGFRTILRLLQFTANPAWITTR